MESKRGMYVHPLALVVLVATIAVLVTILVMRQAPPLGGAGLAPVQGSSAAAAPAKPASGHKLYYSAMHPWIVQDHPGTCPICGMDLVEMPPEEQAEYEANHPEPA